VQHCPALAMQPAQVLELYLQLLNADASAVAGQLIDLRQALYK